MRAHIFFVAAMLAVATGCSSGECDPQDEPGYCDGSVVHVCRNYAEKPWDFPSYRWTAIECGPDRLCVDTPRGGLCVISSTPGLCAEQRDYASVCQDERTRLDCMWGYAIESATCGRCAAGDNSTCSLPSR